VTPQQALDLAVFLLIWSAAFVAVLYAERWWPW
jgi:hypothetical protein